MKIAMIAAIGMNGELGKDGKLPWHIPEDLKHFKNITLGQVVVMGRKTYESIPKKLEGRTIIVLTTQEDYKPKHDNVEVMHSVGEIMKRAYKKDLETLYVAGGGEMYKHFLPLSDMVYLTRVDKEFEADTFFPEMNVSEWNLSAWSDVGNHDGYRYMFEVFTRRS